jgi:hypothetical protein
VGLHAVDNLSHLAHQEKEPEVEDRYTYDEFVIVAKNGPVGTQLTVETYYGDVTAWEVARKHFLRLFNEQKKPVVLLGRVFN